VDGHYRAVIRGANIIVDRICPFDDGGVNSRGRARFFANNPDRGLSKSHYVQKLTSLAVTDRHGDHVVPQNRPDASYAG
jgi:hypothetical protein